MMIRRLSIAIQWYFHDNYMVVQRQSNERLLSALGTHGAVGCGVLFNVFSIVLMLFNSLSMLLNYISMIIQW